MAKRARSDSDVLREVDTVKVAKAVAHLETKLSREEMLDAIFETWDRDGNESISFEEILPHYMKTRNHLDQTEEEVSHSFRFFCRSRECDASIGISREIFKAWMQPQSVDTVARRYLVAVKGMTKDPYRINLNHAVVKDYEGKRLSEIVKAPPHAIEGIAEHSDAIMKQLGIKTVRDLGTWKFYRLARAVVALAPKEEVMYDHNEHGPLTLNVRNAFHVEHETKSLKELLSLPVSSFAGFPQKCDELLEKLRIKTVEQLGRRKCFEWAAAMVELAEFEQ